MQYSYIKFDHIFAYKWASFGSISAIFVLPYNQKSQKHFYQVTQITVTPARIMIWPEL